MEILSSLVPQDFQTFAPHESVVNPRQCDWVGSVYIPHQLLSCRNRLDFTGTFSKKKTTGVAFIGKVRPIIDGRVWKDDRISMYVRRPFSDFNYFRIDSIIMPNEANILSSRQLRRTIPVFSHRHGSRVFVPQSIVANQFELFPEYRRMAAVSNDDLDSARRY